MSFMAVAEGLSVNVPLLVSFFVVTAVRERFYDEPYQTILAV
jgi:hypothetical protein